ncbi:MAG TPA: 30S ribosomal protein S6 [Phycisphaerales bacterium]|nr:30S ribosomal protein S6 [Phycisphaerales bacterium]
MAISKRVYNYEAMFLIGQAQSGDLAAVIRHIEEIISRGHGEIIAMRKWDERRLAYEIRGQKRGLYILCYFKAPGSELAHIERDCNLSELVLRTLITRADTMTLDQMTAADDRQGLAVEAKLRAERKDQPAPAEPAAEAPATEAAPA